MKSAKGASVSLGYHTHYVVDGGKARIILAALVTPASVMDNTPMLDLERWVRFRWSLLPEIAFGDTKYGTVANIVALEQDGIHAYLPTADFDRRTPFYPAERFAYDGDRDLYICPQGQELPLKVRRKGEQVLVYIADPATCKARPLKSACTAKVDAIFFARISKMCLSEPPATKRRKPTRKPCVNGKSGLNRFLEKANNGTASAVFDSET